MNLIQTARFREVLFEIIEEEKRCHNFIRIFPAKGTDIYNAYFSNNRVLNMALYDVLYDKMLNDVDILPPQAI